MEECPDWAPAEILEISDEDDPAAVCVTWAMYDAMTEGLR